MNSREAKDFLVQQTEEQASLEHLPFSDLESRMMYFTESRGLPRGAIALNDAFDAAHDTAAYERRLVG